MRKPKSGPANVSYKCAAAAVVLLWSLSVPNLLASHIPSGQDVGSSVRRLENAEKQKTILSKLSKETQEKEEVEIEDEDILQPQATQEEPS